jgi:type I restriction enzyme S subunit
LGNLLSDGPRNGISPRPSNDPSSPKAITLTATTSGIFDGQYFKHVEGNFENIDELWLKSGDLLFQRGNTPEYVGMAAYYDGLPGQFIYPDLMIKVRLLDEVDLRYVHMCSISPYARQYLSRRASGAQATMPKINQGDLLALPIPLPPLGEQQRIVVKVDELAQLCNQLIASLAGTGAMQQRLLEALLQDHVDNAVLVKAA